MAIALTLLGSELYTAGFTTSWTTPSVTPAAGSMVILHIQVGSTAAVSSVSGLGGSWSTKYAFSGGSLGNHVLMYATQVPGSPGGVTIGFSASAIPLVHILQCTGYDPSNPIPQATGQALTQTTVNPSTLTSPVNTNSRTAMAVTYNSGTALTPEAGWSSLADQINNYREAALWKSTAWDQTPTASLGSSIAFNAIAYEIAAAPAGAPAEALAALGVG